MVSMGLTRLKTDLHKHYSIRGAGGKNFRTRTMLPIVIYDLEQQYRAESTCWHLSAVAR